MNFVETFTFFFSVITEIFDSIVVNSFDSFVSSACNISVSLSLVLLDPDAILKLIKFVSARTRGDTVMY